jgi:hypothetical protein
MPTFSDADKAMITDYVNNRLAAGDKAGDINRDLSAHWATMDAEATASEAAQNPGPPPEFTPISGTFSSENGPKADPLVDLMVAPLTAGAVNDLVSKGVSAKRVAAAIKRVGFNKGGHA